MVNTSENGEVWPEPELSLGVVYNLIERHVAGPAKVAVVLGRGRNERGMNPYSGCPEIL